jgi:NTE family protein
LVSDEHAPRVGLVLSGGGARGAYEVGVLRYVRERVPPPAPFHVITGSSVGAVNGAYIAATCDRPKAQARLLQRVWSEIRLDEVYRFGWDQMRTLPQVLFGRNLPKITHGSTIGGLVDSRLIESIVRERIPWRGIADNLYRGNLHAFACSATELATGLTTVFVQTATRSLPAWPEVPGQVVVPTAITASHTLASAAIPVLFPAVRVGDQLFVDGSLRQNTPIRPAMHLGAERLLVIGLRHKAATVTAHDRQREKATDVYPNAVFMLGKMLNALMLDKLEADLARIYRTNELIRAGTEIYGPEFAAKIAEGIHGRRGRPYKEIKLVMIQPSEDLGEIAYRIIRTTRLEKYGGMMASPATSSSITTTSPK